MCGWTLAILGVIAAGMPVAFTWRYLSHVRRGRQWWLDHPEAAAARVAHAKLIGKPAEAGRE